MSSSVNGFTEQSELQAIIRAELAAQARATVPPKIRRCLDRTRAMEKLQTLAPTAGAPSTPPVTTPPPPARMEYAELQPNHAIRIQEVKDNDKRAQGVVHSVVRMRGAIQIMVGLGSSSSLPFDEQLAGALGELEQAKKILQALQKAERRRKAAQKRKVEERELGEEKENVVEELDGAPPSKKRKPVEEPLNTAMPGLRQSARVRELKKKTEEACAILTGGTVDVEG